MCGIPEAMAVLSIGQAVMGHQAGKDEAAAKNKANAASARNARIAYNNDIALIETERGAAARTLALSDFKEKLERDKKEAEMKNSGYGDVFAIMRNIAGVHNVSVLEDQQDWDADMLKLQTQETNSYATMQRSYNGLKPLAGPSVLESGLQIGGAIGSYVTDNKAVDRKFLKGYGKDAIK